MLLNKDYDKNDIVTFKLVNGDEIVAKIVELHGDHWVISRPCTIIPSPQGLGLMQTLFAADVNKEIVLKKEHVMMHCSVVKELETHYLSTTSGIQTVSPGRIVT